MARTIIEIESAIKDNLKELGLSASASAEWRTWVHCFAYVIYCFEIIFDLFRKEIDKTSEKMYVGSLAWYNEICYKFQSGHELVFDENTVQVGYAVQDESSRIIKVATVSVADQTIVFKIATRNAAGNIVPLSADQLTDFTNYLDVIKFAGTRTSVVSTSADLLLYDITVYYDPSVPVSDLKESLNDSLESFRTEQTFAGVVYTHKLLEAVTRVQGVSTAKINSLKRKGSIEGVFIDIDTHTEPYAGYFDYSKDCVLTLINVNEL